jgi:hypothetical protein
MNTIAIERIADISPQTMNVLQAPLSDDVVFVYDL